jgi:ligand-binding sensor domain-containing protein
VVSVVRRRDGTLWVATEANGVFRIVGTSAERVPIAPAFGGDSAYTVWEDPEERLWLGAEARVWEIPKGAVTGIPTTGTYPAVIQRFVYLPTTGAVLGYGSHGVFRFDRDHRVVAVDNRAHQFTLAAPLQVLGRDSAWYAIDRDLVLNGRKVYTLDLGSNAPTGRITDLLFDATVESGSRPMVWGLHRLRRSLFTTYSIPEGLAAPQCLRRGAGFHGRALGRQPDKWDKPDFP